MKVMIVCIDLHALGLGRVLGECTGFLQWAGIEQDES